MAEADVLTFHTPLNKSGPYHSLHLADADLLAALPDNRILIAAAGRWWITPRCCRCWKRAKS